VREPEPGSLGTGGTPTALSGHRAPGPDPWTAGQGVTPTVGLTSGTSGHPPTLPRLGPEPGPAPGPTMPAPSPVASTSGTPPGTPPAPPATSFSSLSGGGMLPAVQLVNTPQYKIEFEVTRFGPSGVGGVDVYLTADDGKSWKQYPPADTHPVLPQNAAPGAQTPLRGSVTITLPREGVVFGISLVIRSRAGLCKPPPKPGDPPQVRVEVDTTLPTAELYAPIVDPARKDALLLRWTANDRNLTNTPITLEWKARKEDPWQVIGPAELPHTPGQPGQYSWQPPADIPPSVFLKLTVRDGAGNKAVAESTEPVLVDLIVPEYSIVKEPATQTVPR
jgi:hypothetical protein